MSKLVEMATVLPDDFYKLLNEERDPKLVNLLNVCMQDGERIVAEKI